MVYELEFYANGSEYEYDIDALTGAVVKSQQESRGSAPLRRRSLRRRHR